MLINTSNSISAISAINIIIIIGKSDVYGHHGGDETALMVMTATMAHRYASMADHNDDGGTYGTDDIDGTDGIHDN
eukprot:7194220-Karenia_brevis.AAC.1